jgi:hypothetical protein
VKFLKNIYKDQSLFEKKVKPNSLKKIKERIFTNIYLEKIDERKKNKKELGSRV